MPSREDNQIRKKLAEWGERTDAPPELIDFYGSLLHLQSEARRHTATCRPHLSGKAAAHRLEQGQPLIAFADLELDWPRLRDTVAEVAAIFSAYPRLFGPIPRKPAGLGNIRFLKRAVRAWFEGKKLSPAIIPQGITAPLLSDIIQATLKPLLANCSRALFPRVDQERWRRGYCPICGGNPDFALLERERGGRYLVCGRCDTEWRYQRLECPFCGNQDQKTLAYFTDEDGLYRLYVCEKCHRYLKTIDLRQAKAEVIIPLERLFTLSLDARARQSGYGDGSLETNAGT